jgi:hypothetical protein
MVFPHANEPARREACGFIEKVSKDLSGRVRVVFAEDMVSRLAEGATNGPADQALRQTINKYAIGAPATG